MFETSLIMNIGLKKRYLCFLFYVYLGIKLFGEKVLVFLQHFIIRSVCCAYNFPLKKEGKFIFIFIRINIRIRSLWLKTSYYQNNISKGSRQNGFVTLEKGLALRFRCLQVFLFKECLGYDLFIYLFVENGLYGIYSIK